jgi:hypothetical protein
MNPRIEVTSELANDAITYVLSLYQNFFPILCLNETAIVLRAN